MRIALFQCPSHPADVRGNLRRLEQTARSAAHSGVELLVCPEMFLCGYNIGAEAARRLAEPCDGPSADAVAAIARRFNLDIVYGYAEIFNAEVFNAVNWIGANGERLGHYRKTHLYGELDRAMFKASDEAAAPLVEMNGWRAGMLICYDVEFPENPRRLALAGADLIIVPTANMIAYDFVAATLVPARAIENQLYLAYANYCGDEDGLVYGGLSTIVAPDGTVPARAGRNEAILIADIDLACVTASRERNPYLRGRRPELYRALSQPGNA